MNNKETYDHIVTAAHNANPPIYKTLVGHTTPETGFVVEDYPYGFRLRTQIRYWIETKKGFGQRLCSQTLNPKNGRWNKPKPGTYNVVAVMVEDQSNGHVSIRTLSSGGWSKEPDIQVFEAAHAEGIGEYETRAIRYIRATIKAASLVKYEIKGGEPTQTREEQKEILSDALRMGYVLVARDEANLPEEA